MLWLDHKMDSFVLSAVLLNYVRRSVHRGIVNDEQLPMGIGLPLHRRDGVGNESFHVVAWHDDGYKRLILHDFGLISILQSKP